MQESSRSFRGAGGRAGESWEPDSDARDADASSPASDNGRRTASRDGARFSLENPRNYSVHVVQRGETLTSIAAKRKGLRVADLAWLNGISPNQPLQIGQRLKLPNQSYLDAGRDAKNKFVALVHYMDTHAGHLPPDAANPPPIDVQIEAEGVRTELRSGYRYEIDNVDRTRHIVAQIRLAPEQRSKREQANAGKPDRRNTDDGGHFIAARFNGPRDWFNHFAQDSSFNRGAYRALEDTWARELRAGKRVLVDIVPHYHGTSKRPYLLTVTSFIDGQRVVQVFPNERVRR
jgi:LysM repeat protein